MQPRSRLDTRGLAGKFSPLPRANRGAVAVILAIMLAAIIGVMALAVDLGRAWNLQTELQNAADADVHQHRIDNNGRHPTLGVGRFFR